MRLVWTAILVLLWSANLVAQVYPNRKTHTDPLPNMVNNPFGASLAPASPDLKSAARDTSVYAPELSVPDDARASYILGLQYLKGGDAAKAEEAFRKAAEIYPKYSSAFNGLGVALRNQKKMKEASDALEHALQVNPNNADAQTNLAALLLSENRTADAERLLQRATNLQPHEPEGLVMLAYVELALKHYGPSISAADAIGQDGRKAYPVVRMIRARALEMSGRTREALSEYKAYLKTKPDEAHVKIAEAAIARLRSSDRH